MSIRVAHQCSVDLADATGFDTGRAQHANPDIFRAAGLRTASCMSRTRGAFAFAAASRAARASAYMCRMILLIRFPSSRCLLASLPSRSQDGSQSSWFDCTVVVRSFNWGARRFIGNAKALCDGAPRTMSTQPRYRSPQPNQRLRVSPMLRTAAWMPGPARFGNSTCASMARSVSARCVKSPTTCSAL